MLGSSIDRPAHVPEHVLRTADLLLQLGGALWAICYVLFVRAALRTRSYGLPMFALASNIAFDIVLGLLLADDAGERAGFATYALTQVGLLYAVATYGAHEWAHAPLVQRHLRAILATMVAGCLLAHWSVVRWWLASNVGAHRGKTYAGRVGGPDTQELAFWGALVCQAYLSAASLAQLLVRAHTGGVDWPTWAARTGGSLLGLYGHYGYLWWHWPEMYEYFVNPLAVVLCLVGLASDAVYPFVFAHVRTTERVLLDGRRIPGQVLVEKA